MRTLAGRGIAILLMAGFLASPLGAQQRLVQKAAVLALPPELTEAKVRAHVIAPARLQDIQIEEVDETREVHYAFPGVIQKLPPGPRLDLGAFGLAINTVLKSQVAGYILQVRRNGALVHNGIWNWAQTPADQGKGWTDDTRMHVASVSKFLTAVGMVKALDSKGIPYDTKIIGYLPDYWTKGPNIDKITFKHLMTHRSGFSTGGSGTNYEFMKGKVAAGVPMVGGYDYENMNFGLCRILIPIVMGNIGKSAMFVNPADMKDRAGFTKATALNDQAWDAVTLYHYKKFMQTKVFTPAGVVNASFEPFAGGKNALAYPYSPGSVHGWDSGDLATVAGGAGWRLSTKELLNVMNAVRRKNTILPAEKAQFLLDNYFGIDQAIDTPAGKIYNKNGAWGTGDGRREQCVAYFLPNQMELVLFVNSPIGKEGFSLRGIVKDAYLGSLTN
jgi:CubicO group peptidase (beta-lactamase class C family)